MPRDTTTDDIGQAYFDGWRLGLKALAIYRDGSKESQPLNTSSENDKAKAKELAKPRRERLPDTRQSITHKFSIAGHEGYITVGLFPDGRPGELFITMAKEGSTIGGLMDAFGTSVSMSLQYGVPLEDYVRKFSHMRFEPQGHTKNPDIRIAKSLIDYIFRWLGITFLPGYKEASLGMPLEGAAASPPSSESETAETQLVPVAKKADGRNGGQEAKAESGKLKAEKASTAAPADSRQPTAESRPSNGHTNGNGHGVKAKGNGSIVLLGQVSDALKSTATSATAGSPSSAYSAKLLERAGVMPKSDVAGPSIRSEQFAGFQVDAPACDGCGAITVRNGNCYLCHNCGNSMGCS
jgi:ribonucleoside-diphosphate reductase alpha chain